MRPALIPVIGVIAEAVRAAGSVPSGQVYAHVLGLLDLSEYERCIEILGNAGLVLVDGNVLVWIGPALEPSK